MWFFAVACVSLVVVNTASDARSQPTPPAANRSLCVSNRGKPYDEEHCREYATTRGCAWLNGQCICKNRASYSKKQRRCEAVLPIDMQKKDTPMTSVATPPGPLSPSMLSLSVCISNLGEAYDEEYCNLYGKDRGCAWQKDRCSCKHGRSYSKKHRRCEPAVSLEIQKYSQSNRRSKQGSTTSTVSLRVRDGALRNSSTCVSNRGRPYDEHHCDLYGKQRGCIWQDGHCVCEEGGRYSKKRRVCWFPSPAPHPMPAPPPSPMPSASSSTPAVPSPSSRGDRGSWFEHLLYWFPGPGWMSVLLDSLLGISCTACAIPGARRRAMQYLPGVRHPSLLGGAPRQAMLRDHDHVEVVSPSNLNNVA